MKTYIYQIFGESGMACECEETFIASLTRPHRKWQLTPCVMNEVGRIVPIAPVLYEGDDIEEILTHLKSGGYFRFTEVVEKSNDIEEAFGMFDFEGFEPITFDVICFELV